MSRFNKRLAMQFGGLVVVVLGSAFALEWTQRFMRQDAFAGYRQEVENRMNRPEVTGSDVSLTHYDGDKKVLEARVGEFTATAGRQIVKGTKIEGGKLYRDGKVELEFNADTATWSDIHKSLTLAGNIHVQNKDLNLKTGALVYNQLTGKMHITSKVTGKLFGGTVSSEKLDFDVRKGTGKITNIVWQGKVNQDVVPAPPREWTFGPSQVNFVSRDELEIIRFDATDKEIAVKSEKALWNRKTDVTVAVGKVRYYSADMNVICDKATINRKDRHVILEGVISVYLKPESDQTLKVVPLTPIKPISPEEVVPTGPSPQNPQSNDEVRSLENRRKYPVEILATRVDYWYAKGERRAEIVGKPQARQELPESRWRYVWAHKASWNGESDILTLFSEPNKRSVRLRTSLGDDISFKSFWISTAEGDERYGGEDAQGKAYVDEPEESPRTSPPVGGT